MTDYERMELLAQIAEMYYIQDLSQAAIANKFFFSRSKVSRLLTEARESGLIEISIRHPFKRASELERILLERYQLKQAVILKSGSLSIERMLKTLGRLSAKYLLDNLIDGDILGIGWGTAIYEVAQALQPKNLIDFSVVQIIGSAGFGDPAIDGPEVARYFAENFSGKYFTLNAPVMVKDKATRDILIKERNIDKVIKKAIQADYILAGIGSSSMLRSVVLAVTC